MGNGCESGYLGAAEPLSRKRNSVTEQPKPNPEKVIPIAPGYICIPTVTASSRNNGPSARLAVTAIAERADGVFQACVLNAEGRLEFAPGPVYPEGPTHDETSSSKALQEISQTLKMLVTLEQAKAKKA
jgi:hypothetical protein